VIRSCVTVSLVEEARGGPFVFWHDLPAACRQARAIGFDAVEVFPPAADAVDANQLRTLLSDHGLALGAVGTGAGWVKGRLHLCLADAAARARARAFIRSIIDLGGSLGAPAIIGSMQGRSGDGVDSSLALAYLADALEDLGEYAKQFRVPLLFEPLNRYETNLVTSIEKGVQLLQSLSVKNVLLLADLFHMNIEEADIAGALWESAGFIGHLHFVDSNRQPAGLGHLNFPPIAQALQAIGYHGYASAEAFPYPDSAAAARQTMKAFRRYFGDFSSRS
jgi:sugar phosphate isomerase/epimerase